MPALQKPCGDQRGLGEMKHLRQIINFFSLNIYIALRNYTLDQVGWIRREALFQHVGVSGCRQQEHVSGCDRGWHVVQLEDGHAAGDHEGGRFALTALTQVLES